MIDAVDHGNTSVFAPPQPPEVVILAQPESPYLFFTYHLPLTTDHGFSTNPLTAASSRAVTSVGSLASSAAPTTAPTTTSIFPAWNHRRRGSSAPVSSYNPLSPTGNIAVPASFASNRIPGRNPCILPSRLRDPSGNTSTE